MNWPPGLKPKRKPNIKEMSDQTMEKVKSIQTVVVRKCERRLGP